MEAFLWRLAETIAWWKLRESDEDPLYRLGAAAQSPDDFWDEQDRLRTPALKPSTDLGDLRDADRPAAIAGLSKQRAALLRERGFAPQSASDDLAGGRLLAWWPDETLNEGASQLASRGFFAGEDDAPPWDTWFWYDHEPNSEPLNHHYEYSAGATFRQGFAAWWRPMRSTSVLISWVPAGPLPLATAGLQINSSACIEWLGRLDTALTRSLRVAELFAADLRTRVPPP